MPLIAFGIDIGITGAVAVINKSGLSAILDMPASARGKGNGKVSNEINPALLACIFRDHLQREELDPASALAVFEGVHAMPGQGSTTGFSLGDSNGVVRAVLGTIGIASHVITPMTWKKHFNLISTGPKMKRTPTMTQEAERQLASLRSQAKAISKENARALAIQLYPAAAPMLARKADHNRAEAVLIARYGWEELR